MRSRPASGFESSVFGPKAFEIDCQPGHLQKFAAPTRAVAFLPNGGLGNAGKNLYALRHDPFTVDGSTPFPPAGMTSQLFDGAPYTLTLNRSRFTFKVGPGSDIVHVGRLAMATGAPVTSYTVEQLLPNETTSIAADMPKDATISVLPGTYRLTVKPAAIGGQPVSQIVHVANAP